MTNWDADAARSFHERTKHSFASVRRSGHRLDWETRPHPFKEYAALDPVPLPEGKLERLLRWGAGVVRTRTFPGGDVYHFRTYSSAGGLYPVEVYAACGDLPGLAAGLYHFHPRELVLHRLRGGDVRGAVAEAAAAASLAEAELVLLLTGIMWRSAWKYQARAYRHLYWDAGTMLANLLALAESAGLAAHLFTGFVDVEVNALLGIDGRREAALALLGVGRADAAPPRAVLEPLEPDVAPLSAREVEYAEAHALHDASSLWGADEVRRYRGEATPPETSDGFVSALGLTAAELEDAIRRRGSVRDFATDPVPAGDLASILHGAAAPIPADVRGSNEVHLIANAVAGLAPGSYRFSPPDRFELEREGGFRREAAYLCLEQPLAGLAAGAHFLLADLEDVLARHGTRGYRATQLEGGVRAGRIYLGAFARGLAATASTFYDDDVTSFFARGTAKAPILAVAVGRKPRRRR